MKKLLYFIGIFLLSSYSGILDSLADTEVSLDTGDTAWIMTATALVLFMTLPGLALFYGGLVNSKNVVSALMHVIALACLMSVLWLFGAYSFAFTDGGDLNKYIGSITEKFLFNNVEWNALSGTIPENVFFIFQLTFAVITPALMVGAYVERIKFSSVLLISGIWLFVVYAPVTHWVWGGGWLADLGVLDFAGGLVVHTTAGVSALVIAILLGNRNEFPNSVQPPHNPGLVMVGACMLWVGWFGFNGGSALAANGGAGMAIAATHISAATACLVWISIEWIKFGKPSLVGIATGAIAGLATITPGSGFVGPVGALIYGALAGFICFSVINVVKNTWKIDDSLDVFAVHGVGGILGILLTSFFADSSLGGMGLAEGVSMGMAFTGQLLATVVTVIWAGVASFIIVKFVQTIVGLRVDNEDETEGLDLTYHGERGYDL